MASFPSSIRLDVLGPAGYKKVPELRKRARAVDDVDPVPVMEEGDGRALDFVDRGIADHEEALWRTAL